MNTMSPERLALYQGGSRELLGRGLASLLSRGPPFTLQHEVHVPGSLLHQQRPLYEGEPLMPFEVEQFPLGIIHIQVFHRCIPS